MIERPHDGPLREGSTFLVMAPYTKGWMGGVPQIRHNETVWLNNHGYRAIEVMPRESWGSIGWEGKDSMSLGVAMHTNHDKLGTMAEYSLADPTEFWKYLKYGRFDVMDGHEAEQYESCYWFAGIRVFPWTVDMISEHADATIKHLKKFAPAAAAHTLLGFGDVPVVNGEEMARKYKEANGIDYRIIRNPINVVNFNKDVKPLAEIAGVNLQDGKKNILFVGRLEKRKGVDIALRAIAMLIKDPDVAKDFRFIIAGSGSEEENLKALAKELEIERFVVFTGEFSEEIKPALYAAAHFVFVPSITDESSGLTPAEGSASGKAILGGPAYKVGKLIVHGETGFQMESADPSEAKKYLKLMLADEDSDFPGVDLAAMGLNGREFISQFSEDIIFQQRVDLANEIRMWKLDRYHRQRMFFYVPEIPILHRAIEFVWKNPVKS